MSSSLLLLKANEVMGLIDSTPIIGTTEFLPNTGLVDGIRCSEIPPTLYVEVATKIFVAEFRAVTDRCQASWNPGG